MNHIEIKQYAINYSHEHNFWDTIDEYIESFNITSLEDIKHFKFLAKIELYKNDKNRIKAELLPIFNNCISFKAENINNKEKFIIFHPCTYLDYKYQISYFDQHGAIMDEKSNTIEEAMQNYIHNNDYKIVEVI